MRLMAAEVQVDVDGGVMVVTVNRPRARNAITRPVAEAIAAAFDALDASGELMAGVLTGTGGTFCSGRDLKAALAGEPMTAERAAHFGLVNRLTADGQALAEAVALAGR